MANGEGALRAYNKQRDTPNAILKPLSIVIGTSN